MEKTTKITKRAVLEDLIKIADTGAGELDWSDIRNYAENEIRILDNKVVKARERAAKAKEEADALTDAVFDATSNEFETIADIAERVVFDGEFSVSKVGHRLRKLVESGLVEKGELKFKPEGGKTTTRVAYKRVEDAE